jgi:phenylpyruvate tautomerase PptA (4-oxalocrotonate tautomerase family)
MSEYDDPPESTEEEIAAFETEKAVEHAPGITITGLTPEAIQIVVEAAVERNYRLQERVGEAVDKAVKKAISAGIDDAMRRLAEEALRPAIAEVIANGWQKTDSYGQPQGPKQSLAQRITEFLFERDRYSGNGTVIDKVFKEELDKALKTEAGKAFQEALASFKGKVDTEINGRIISAVRSVMGLKS